MEKLERIERAADFIREKCGEAETGLILGSGLADVIGLENAITIEYKDIPGFPVSTAPGHKSEWLCGELEGKRVFVMRGRFHSYEGYSGEDIALPVRVMKKLGVKTLILTCAAGGVNTDFTPGDIMVINDHINYFGLNPLVGANIDELGPRFPDMCGVYTTALLELAHKCAGKLGMKIWDGVYFYFGGPSFETPAEIKMARILGGDAVGMSTVPEAIAARHCDLRVLGLSCITNMAAGILDKPLSEEEVLETGARVRDDFAALIGCIVREM